MYRLIIQCVASCSGMLLLEGLCWTLHWERGVSLEMVLSIAAAISRVPGLLRWDYISLNNGKELLNVCSQLVTLFRPFPN